jgi:hypothetical protein
MNRTIDQITEMFAFKEEVIHPDCGRILVGFLLPPRDRSICAYGRACLEVIAKIQQHKDQQPYPFVGIHSIDDSGCSLWGKAGGTYEDIDRAIAFLTRDGPHCPNKEEIEAWCKTNGFYAEYW